MGIFSLSKSGTLLWLGLSELSLLIFGTVLVVGLAGEYSASEKWKSHVKIFEVLVILGVAGELIADGGIFLFSRHLQTILNAEIAKSLKLASEAEERAEIARKDAEGFRLRILQLEAQFAPREISSKQREALVKCLSSLKGQSVNLFGQSGDPELADFGKQLESVLKDAGLQVYPLNLGLPVGGSTIRAGLSLAIGNDRMRTSNELVLSCASQYTYV